MFANDTTVYMADTDDLDMLWKVLKRWCTAAGARFNESKMEVIPIGTRKYRTKVLRDRRTGPNAKEIDTKIHIAKEGEVTRILGGWIGNGIRTKTFGQKR